VAEGNLKVRVAIITCGGGAIGGAAVRRRSGSRGPAPWSRQITGEFIRVDGGKA
jgi:hypothetical protein